MPIGDEDYEEDDQAQYFDSPAHLINSNQGTSNQDNQRRYPSEDDPQQLLSPHEKVEELYSLLNQQRHGGDSGGSQQQQVSPQHLIDELSPKLRQAEDERDQMKNFARQRELDIEKMLQ